MAAEHATFSQATAEVMGDGHADPERNGDGLPGVAFPAAADQND